MKNKAITILCAATMSLVATTPVLAAPDPEPAVATADALIMRPALFATTVAGSAIFVATLPFSLISRSVKPAARALVVAPAKATFARPLGDFDYGTSSCGDQVAANY